MRAYYQYQNKSKRELSEYKNSIIKSNRRNDQTEKTEKTNMKMNGGEGRGKTKNENENGIKN